MIARWMAQQALQNEIAKAGVRYAWIIDEEYETDWVTNRGKWQPIEDGPVMGPSDATEEELELARTKGSPFRLDYDGEDGPALRGRMWTNESCHPRDGHAAFQPLEDYGEGGYGCTTILWRSPSGKWEVL